MLGSYRRRRPLNSIDIIGRRTTSNCGPTDAKEGQNILWMAHTHLSAGPDVLYERKHGHMATFACEGVSLKVASAILGWNINDHVHLIFPPDPLAARPVSRSSKKRVSVGNLCSEMTHNNKWYYQPLRTRINSIPTNHRQGACCGVLCCVHDRFYWMHKTLKGGTSWLCLFGISLRTPTEVTSPDIAGTTLNSGGIHVSSLLLLWIIILTTCSTVLRHPSALSQGSYQRDKCWLTHTSYWLYCLLYT